MCDRDIQQPVSYRPFAPRHLGQQIKPAFDDALQSRNAYPIILDIFAESPEMTECISRLLYTTEIPFKPNTLPMTLSGKCLSTLPFLFDSSLTIETMAQAIASAMGFAMFASCFGASLPDSSMHFVLMKAIKPRSSHI